MTSPLDKKYVHYTEQDTLDTLVLPFLTQQYKYPPASSLDYQAQHTLPVTMGGTGRYDGLYLSGGYPYCVLEGKRYSHDLTDDDVAQARAYATSSFFDKPVPFLIISNGREHRFLQITTTIDPADGKPEYLAVPPTSWKQVTTYDPGEVRQMLTEAQLLGIFRDFKRLVYRDLRDQFSDPTTKRLDTSVNPMGESLKSIIQSRRTFLGETAKGATEPAKQQNAIEQALEGIALHFTIKILFIKLIEDLARGGASLRIVHTLFPQREYDQIGGLFGYKVLAALDRKEEIEALRVFSKSKTFYKRLNSDIARVSWADIFRYGFSVNVKRFGQLFKAKHYDRFMPSEDTLASIRQSLVKIDIRTAVIYGSAAKRSNVIGDLYEKLIGDEVRSGLGAVYTPDNTMRFMVELGRQSLGQFRGHKVVEPACGSGHFYREIYRRYVDEVLDAQSASGKGIDARSAHAEALSHVYGRDIDPFAVQLTLLSTFLEQLKDNVSPEVESDLGDRWLANRSVDTQNSLDPITVDPDSGFDIHKTADLGSARSLKDSAKRSLHPDLMIGNPPYGVKVVEGVGYKDVYDLQSKDSYGYFISNAISRLPEGRRLIFIVSSSFLTIGSHRKLREEILRTCKIIRLVKLHRSTFPGIDTFPVIVELERCSDLDQRESNVYQFYDLWRFNPQTDAADLTTAYTAILSDPTAANPWPFADTLAKRYQVRQGIIAKFYNKPIFEGRPSLYEFMADLPATAPEAKLVSVGGQVITARHNSVRGLDVFRLSSLASVRIGLQSGDNARYYRVAPGTTGGAVKGGYKTVSIAQVLSDADLQGLTAAEKADGILVNDPESDKFWVPLDKAGAADIEAGLLAEYWRPAEFYVDWSNKSVSEMKAHEKGVFRNSQYYFRHGISFSNTGIYSPTYRLGLGGVFDQKGSVIFCDAIDRRVLLGMLSSKLLRYFAKAFINHGVDSQIDDLPIVIPDAATSSNIKSLVDKIIACQQSNSKFDYRPLSSQIDDCVFDLYMLTADERTEVRSWYVRHYPNLV